MTIKEIIDENFNIINAYDNQNINPLSYIIKQYLECEDKVSRNQKIYIMISALKNGAIPTKENFYQCLSNEHGVEIFQIFKQHLKEYYKIWLEHMENKIKIQTIHVDSIDTSIENLTSNKMITHLLLHRQPENVFIEMVKSQKTARNQNLLIMVYLAFDLIQYETFAKLYEHLINPFARFDIDEIVERNQDYSFYSSILNSYRNTSLTEYILEDTTLQFVGQRLLDKLVSLTKDKLNTNNLVINDDYAQEVMDLITYTLRFNLNIERQKRLLPNVYKIHELVMKKINEEIQNIQVDYFLK